MIASSIIDHYNNGLSIVLDSFYNDVNDIQKNTSGPNDSIIAQIKDVIDTKVRPAVAEDGGDIIFDSFKDGIVYLRMQGACSGCPSSTITLKAGVENLLKRYVPEVQSVESI
jgi:Fe-S cluster biogenesis protein NfuA